jgi:hypothetical protein
VEATGQTLDNLKIATTDKEGTFSSLISRSELVQKVSPCHLTVA